MAELESIWKGSSAASENWFEVVCKPKIEEALSALVKGRIAQAPVRQNSVGGLVLRIDRDIRIHELVYEVFHAIPSGFWNIAMRANIR